MTRDQIIEQGVRAHRRRQQRFGDQLSRDMLAELVDAEGGKVVLDAKYNICIVREPEHESEPARPTKIHTCDQIQTVLRVGTPVVVKRGVYAGRSGIVHEMLTPAGSDASITGGCRYAINFDGKILDYCRHELKRAK